MSIGQVPTAWLLVDCQLTVVDRSSGDSQSNGAPCGARRALIASGERVVVFTAEQLEDFGLYVQLRADYSYVVAGGRGLEISLSRSNNKNEPGIERGVASVAMHRAEPAISAHRTIISGASARRTLDWTRRRQAPDSGPERHRRHRRRRQPHQVLLQPTLPRLVGSPRLEEAVSCLAACAAPDRRARVEAVRVATSCCPLPTPPLELGALPALHAERQRRRDRATLGLRPRRRGAHEAWPRFP